jgi:hypothetical protein
MPATEAQGVSSDYSVRTVLGTQHADKRSGSRGPSAASRASGAHRLQSRQLRLGKISRRGLPTTEPRVLGRWAPSPSCTGRGALWRAACTLRSKLPASKHEARARHACRAEAASHRLRLPQARHARSCNTRRRHLTLCRAFLLVPRSFYSIRSPIPSRMHVAPFHAGGTKHERGGTKAKCHVT